MIVVALLSGSTLVSAVSAQQADDLHVVPSYSAVQDAGVVLSWDPVEGADGFVIYRSVDAGLGCETSAQIAVRPGSATEFRDFGLTNGERYTYALQARQVNRRGPCARLGPVVPSVEPYSWHFNRPSDAIEGWEPSGGTIAVDEVAVAEGVLHLGGIANGATVSSPDHLSLNPARFPSIEMRLANNSAAAASTFSWTTGSDPTWSESKSVRFVLEPNSGFKTYRIAPPTDAWTGAVRRVRIGFDNPAGGDVDIDFIRARSLAWDFLTDAEGWTGGTYSGGNLVASGRDSLTLTSREGLDFDASRQRRVRLVMDLSSPAGIEGAKAHTRRVEGRLSWTKNRGSWSTQESVTFDPTSCSAGCVIDNMGAEWSGTIGQLRLSLVDTMASNPVDIRATIASIEVIADGPEDPLTGVIYFTGNGQYHQGYPGYLYTDFEHREMYDGWIDHSADFAWRWNLPGTDLYSMQFWTASSGAEVTAGPPAALDIPHGATGEPVLTSPDRLEIETDRFRSVDLTVFNPTSSTTGRIWWRRFQDSTWDVSRSKQFSVAPSGWSSPTVPLDDVATWDGMIRQVMIEVPEQGAAGAVTRIQSLEFPRGYSNPKIDQDLAIAADAGIDYFAFTWFGSHPNVRWLNQVVEEYRHSTAANKPKYALMPISGSETPGATWVGDGDAPGDFERWTAPDGEAEYLLENFLDPSYLKVEGNRPLLYWFNSAKMSTQPGGWGDQWEEALDHLRRITREAGLGDPFIVDACRQYATVKRLGFDGVSAYGPCGVKNAAGPEVNDALALRGLDERAGWVPAGGHMTYDFLAESDRWQWANDSKETLAGPVKVMSPVTGVLDHRSIDCWKPSNFWYDIPMRSEWESNYRSAREALQQYPGRSSTPGSMLIYAWSEIQEGGQGIMPTKQEGTMFVDAIRHVTSNRGPGPSHDMVNNSALGPAEEGPGFTWGPSWQYAGPDCGPMLGVSPVANPPFVPYAHVYGQWGFFGSDEHLSAAPGDPATLTADATGFRVIGATGPDRGKLKILIDGEEVPGSTVDLYSPATQRQRILFEIEGLSPGPHTLAVSATGERNPQSSGTKVGIDVVRVARPQPVGSAPEAPQRVSVSREPRSVLVSWDRVNGASNYTVHRAPFGTLTDPGQAIAQVSQPSGNDSRVRYSDKTVSPNTTYVYWVTSDNSPAESNRITARDVADLSEGMTISASSSQPGHGPELAFDGDPTTEWRPLTSGTGEHLTVGFKGDLRQINRFNILENGARVGRFQIQYCQGPGGVPTNPLSYRLLYEGAGIGDGQGTPRSITVRPTEAYAKDLTCGVKLLFVEPTKDGQPPSIAELSISYR